EYPTEVIAMSHDALRNPVIHDLYRAHPDGHYPAQLADIFDAIIAEAPCGDRPHYEARPVGEWSCDAEKCLVREVRVEYVPEGDDSATPPPVLRCPLCGGVMTFGAFLRDVTLTPVRGGSEG